MKDCIKGKFILQPAQVKFIAFTHFRIVVVVRRQKIYYFSNTFLPKQLIMNTEIFSHINWLAVLAGGLAYFFLGAVWYTALFGKKWQSYNAHLMSSADAKKGAAATMFISFLLMFLCAIGLAVLATRFGIFGWVGGLKLGLVTGFCFAATAVHISYVYEKRPLGLHLINGLYNVAGNVIAAIIICAWR